MLKKLFVAQYVCPSYFHKTIYRQSLRLLFKLSKTFPFSKRRWVGMACRQANCSSVKIVIAGPERVLQRCNLAVMQHFVVEELTKGRILQMLLQNV